MTCSSGSVKNVADKTIAAKEQVEKLQNMLLSQDALLKERFNKLISENLSKGKIYDSRQVSFNSDIKTEYVSEFSLDKIAGVVIKALSAAAKATDPMIPNPATSPEALAAYGDLVNSVAEAAKSSSNAAASLSFSMTRLSPGMFAFLYATSVNIKDVDTFGSEAVSSTAVYYCFMQSIDDLKNEAEFSLAKIDSNSLVHMKTLQAALIDDLAKGVIDINIWMAKDTAYSVAIQTLQNRMNARHFKNGLDKFSADTINEKISPIALSIANAAIDKLLNMGSEFKVALIKTQHRIESDYF